MVIKNLQYLKKLKEIHIVGLSGAEGSAIALFLIGQGLKNLVGHDFSPKGGLSRNYRLYHQTIGQKQISDQLKKLKSGFQKIHYRDDYLVDVKKAEIIFTPSSWHRYAINQPLAALKPKLWNWYNLICLFYPGKIIGVTGTAGKGTTVNLIFRILKEAKKPSAMVGDSWQNFDLNALILNSDKSDLLVAELSNRTLKFAPRLKKSPWIAVITNITKNHLDDHHNSLADYISSKKEIARYQNAAGFILINSRDPISKKLKNIGRGKKIPFSASDAALKSINNPNLIGKHLLSDAAAAIKVAEILKIGKPAILAAINNFPAREGRMQFIGQKKGIKFYNDAASSRPEATQEALKAFPKGSVHLILEGSRFHPDKKQFENLLKTARRQKVLSIQVSGKISRFILKLSKKYPITENKNLRESLKKSWKVSKKGQIVLLSPACESFGEFRDYRERIALFNEFYKQLS